MSQEPFSRIDPAKMSISPNVAVDLFDVNDKKLKTLGTAKLKITHGDESFTQNFIITTGTSEPCILGLDGISSHGFCFNSRDQTIFRLQPTETFGRDGTVLTVDRNVTLPPRSSNVFLLVENEKTEAMCLDAGSSEKTSESHKIGDKVVAHSKPDEIVIPIANVEICNTKVESGQKDQSMLIDPNSKENCNNKFSKTCDEKVTNQGNKTQEKIGQNGQTENNSSPNKQIKYSTTKAVHENQNKYRIYRISHTEETESKIEIRPFTLIQDGEQKTFVDLRNHSNVPLRLPEKTKLAKIEGFEIWDPGIESVKSVKAVNELDLSKVTKEMKAPLRELLQEYSDIFSEQGYDIGKTDVIQHHIDTGDHRPIRLRPYRTPHKLKAEMQKHVQEMLKNNIIRHSSSPWAAPALLVSKNDGSTRFVVDYRKLNQATKFDSYPMPKISDILDQLNGKKYFTCLDLASGYHNVCVDPKSQEKTAFVVEHGLYEYKRMPFGLVSAPASFSRLMDHVFRGQLDDFLLVYLDDLIIFSDTLEEHLEHLREVFKILREAKLKLKGKKCQFFLQEVSFLGHVVTPDGIKPDPGKIEKILNFKVPTNVKQVQSFLGLASYYRRFIKDFSKIAHPLIELTKKNGEKNFVWGEDQQRAFDVLRKHLITPPILAYPDWSKDFMLFTDASNYGLGAILSQLNNEGHEVVIAYASRHLSQSEMKYSATEKEALAVVFGAKHFKHYLTGNHFTIISDARPLVWLNSIKDPTGKLARWALELSNLKYTIKYRPGRMNQNADCLSRMLQITSEPTPVPLSTIEEEQAKDPFCQAVMKYLNTGEMDDPDYFPDWRKFIELFNIENGILVHYFLPIGKKLRKDEIRQVVVPLSLRPVIMELLHDNPTSGHFAFLRTFLSVQKRFYWPNFKIDILNYCKACLVCAKNRKSTVRPPLTPIDIAKGPFDVISIDYMGPIHPVSPSGNSYILTITDLFTKWADCIPLPDTSALTTAKALIKAVYYKHGAPKCILSDRDTSFTALLFRSLCKDLGIKQKFSTPYHSQNCGSVERQNLSFMTMVRHYVNEAHDNWEDVLEPLQFAYCNSVHSSTYETPFFLVHGRDPNHLIDIIFDYAKNKPLITPNDFKSQLLEKLSDAFHRVRENTQLARQQYKTQYDKRAKELDFKPGDRVLLDIKVVPKGHSKKLLSKYQGPFHIVRVFGKGVVTIAANGIEKKVNVCRLKPLSPGMIWRDEYCEPYSEPPFGTATERLQGSKNQSTSTEDLGSINIPVEEPQLETGTSEFDNSIGDDQPIESQPTNEIETESAFHTPSQIVNNEPHSSTPENDLLTRRLRPRNQLVKPARFHDYVTENSDY